MLHITLAVIIFALKMYFGVGAKESHELERKLIFFTFCFSVQLA